MSLTAAAIISIAMGLGKVLPSIAGLIKGDKAEKTATDLLDIAKEITGQADPQEAVNSIVADPELQARMSERYVDYLITKEQEESKRLESVNATIRAEVASKDGYNSRWRSTYGYCVSFTWTLFFIGFVVISGYAVIKTPTQATLIIGALAGLISSTMPLWGIALAILGVAVYKRSQDKQTSVGLDTTGLISKVLGSMGK